MTTLFELSALASSESMGRLEEEQRDKLKKLREDRKKYLNEYKNKNTYQAHDLVTKKYKNQSIFFELVIILTMTKVYFNGRKSAVNSLDQHTYLIALAPLPSWEIILGDTRMNEYGKPSDVIGSYKSKIKEYDLGETYLMDILIGNKKSNNLSKIANLYWSSLKNENPLNEKITKPIWII